MSRKSRLSRVTPTRPTNRNRHERFLSAFLGEAAGNATRAAIIAGYPKGSARQTAHRLLSNNYIRTELSKRTAEAAMSAGEALARLSGVARGTLEDFIDVQADGSPRINLGRPGASEKLGLLKRVKMTTRTIKTKDAEIVETRAEIELHDPLRALELIARYHGLTDAKASELADLLDAIEEKRRQRGAA